MKEQAPERSSKEQVKNIFMTYVRTLQADKKRLKGEQSEGVFIPQKEIEKRFFVHPHHNRKQCISELVLSGELEMINIAPVTKTTYARYEYRALRAGAIDLSLLPLPDQSLIGSGSRIMREYLKRVSLPAGAPSTEYFDFFLQHKDQAIEHFFTVDAFAQRVHTPITNFHRPYRANLLIDELPTVGLDVKTMQPLLLGKILKQQIGVNDFTDWIERGEDIYEILQRLASLRTRDEGKKRFFEILFAPPSDELRRMFGNADWIRWINKFKSKCIKENPHSTGKPYSNMAWLLQCTEVSVMRKVWKRLNEAGIVFLSVHDEIIVKEEDRHTAERLFRSLLNQEFKFYQLNFKQQETPEPASLPASYSGANAAN